jgi:hypothetical protein
LQGTAIRCANFDPGLDRKDGGYALVFDTYAISSAMTSEARRWQNLVLFGGDVLYSDATPEAIQNEFGETHPLCFGSTAQAGDSTRREFPK